MFYIIYAIVFYRVQCFAVHGQWMHVSCIMIDIGHGAHHGCEIMYSTPWELLPREFHEFESTLPSMKFDLQM